MKCEANTKTNNYNDASCLIMVHSLTGMFWGGTSCLGSCVGLWTGWHCEEPSLLSGVSPKESTKHSQHRKTSSWKSQKPSARMPTADADSPELHFWAIGHEDSRLCSAWTSQEKNHPGQEIAHLWCHKWQFFICQVNDNTPCRVFFPSLLLNLSPSKWQKD